MATEKQAAPATSDGGTPLTAWNLVAQLLQGDRYGDAGWTTAAELGVARTWTEWEALLEAMMHPQGPIGDTTTFVLALARLDPQVDTALRSAPLWRRLLRDVGLPLDRVFRPWALPAPASEFLELWVVDAGREVRSAALSPDGSSLALGHDGGADAWDLTTQTRAPDALVAGRAVRQLAVDGDGTFWTTLGEEGLTALPMGTRPPWYVEGVRSFAFSGDGRWLTTVTRDGVIRRAVGMRAHTVTLTERSDVVACAVSPDGSLVATADGGTVTLWDAHRGIELAHTASLGRSSSPCAFVAGGRLLAVPGSDGTTRLLDVPTLEARGDVGVAGPAVVGYGVSGDGHLLAVVHEDGSCRVWEEVEAPTSLPVVVADTPDGTDRLDVSADATALANVIAARSTSPPLSIGLFGDWGSGKSFLIGQVQRRIRTIARRARQTEGSPYCGYVRNIEFNAWHYADGNLWASLVTHIFEQLGTPDAEGGVSNEAIARAQVRRLEQQLADRSIVREELEQARQRARQAEARKSLLQLTWNLSGAKGDGSLEDVQRQAGTVRGALALLLPNVWSRIVAAVVVLALAGLAVALASGWSALPAGLLAGIAAWGAWAGAKVRALLGVVDRTAKVAEVQKTSADAELETARATEARLQQELEDLRSGRRLARFAVARGTSSEYRSQLGLISKVHDDFLHMSTILQEQAAASATRGTDEKADVPPVERIVLYIDDLDRCPPKRVVEVLEAVHLILAVPLFVVVVAVDPRWLVQSLRLHYSELLAVDGREAEDDPHWQPTPQDYLEKIIQVPFALRPMRPQGVTALVQGLLPIDANAPGDELSGPVDSAGATGANVDALVVDGDRTEPPAPTAVAVTRPPSLSPRTLALTRAERDAAVRVAKVLRTPRTVKKLTNLYRLLRAGLDEPSGQLDRFLDRADDVPQHEAVLLLLGLIIEVPDEASGVLRYLIGLPEEQAGAPWHEFLDALPEDCGAARAFLVGYLPRMRDRWPAWTCRPFKAWALEVSRYSFATGQEVFAQAPVAAIQEDGLD